MKGQAKFLCLLTLALLVLVPLAAAAAEDEGFRPIFDGKTLKGWDGNPKFWRVEDGCIVGETTAENPTSGNTFIIWRGGKPADLELKVDFRLRNHNSGIQFRSFEVPKEKWVVGGYQSDIEGTGQFSGILYEERARGILALRGQQVIIGEDHKPKVVGQLGDSKDLLSKIDLKGWNEYHIIAQGNHIIQKINGQTMDDVTDEDTKMRRADGIIALQLHAGPPMKVEFRNIRLKELKKQGSGVRGQGSGARSQRPEVRHQASGPRVHNGAALSFTALHPSPVSPGPYSLAAGPRPLAPRPSPLAPKKRIVLIAGPPSHGYASHEHNAGCLLLAKWLNESGLPVEAVVYKNGWPKEPNALEGADAIVIFSDGGGGHPIMPHLEEVGKLMKKGVGLACLHYAVEVPKGKAGDLLKDWTGGYFETFWSVNPFWVADFKKLPDHPITRGVKPFKINDEWYYHMRFMDDMEGVTPILTDVPPDNTHEGRDDAHGGNPTVRARKGMPEHVAWARVRPDGGRGFGFTGGHFHWSWANDGFRTVVLNAIVWIAKVEVPEGGVPSKTPTFAELQANQDKPAPKDFGPEQAQKLIEPWR